MAGVAGIAQAIDDPEIEILEVRPARLGNIADVGRVGGGAYPIAQRWNIAVRKIESRKRHGTALPRSCGSRLLDGMAHQIGG